jgi:hypothetical protein
MDHRIIYGDVELVDDKRELGISVAVTQLDPLSI